jgi:regulator of replication initiation timing
MAWMWNDENRHETLESNTTHWLESETQTLRSEMRRLRAENDDLKIENATLRNRLCALFARAGNVQNVTVPVRLSVTRERGNVPNVTGSASPRALLTRCLENYGD